jgi:ribosomal protein L15
MELNTVQAADGARAGRKRVGRGIGSGLGRPAGAVTRDKSRVRVASTRWASKAARCRYSAVCQSVASSL